MVFLMALWHMGRYGGGTRMVLSGMLTRCTGYESTSLLRMLWHALPVFHPPDDEVLNTGVRQTELW